MARTARVHRLTDKEVKTFALGPETVEDLHDGGGLYLRRRETGAYWYLRFSSPLTGKIQKVKLFAGDPLAGYPHKTLKDARDEADKQRALLAGGLDPRVEKRKLIEREQVAEKARVADKAQARTVKTLWTEFRQSELRPVIKNGKRESGRKDGGAAAENFMTLHVFPHIGDMLCRNVTKHDLYKVAKVMRDREIYRTANVVFQLLRQFFAWALRREYITSNPTESLRKRDFGGQDVSRDRVLCGIKKLGKADELPMLAKKIPDSGMSDTMIASLWLMLATAVRVGELAQAKWEHVDLTKARTWTLVDPKNQLVHVVHLSMFAVAQFKVLQRAHAERVENGEIAEGCPWVLPGRDGKTHMSASTILHWYTDRQQEGEPRFKRTTKTQALLLPGGRWTDHDLRRTAATMMRQLGTLSETVHACLNHRSKRHALDEVYVHDDDERAQRKAFDLLGARLSEVATPAEGNVTPITAAKRRKAA